MELALQSRVVGGKVNSQECHNPCFYGISFAIMTKNIKITVEDQSQSLFLWN